MRSVEASAKTRKEAIDRALKDLGVELHEVEIEIVDEGSRGIFGLGARNVKVRVSTESLPDRSQSDTGEPAHVSRGVAPGREPQREGRRGGRGGRGRGPRPERREGAERPARQERPQSRQEPAPRPERPRPERRDARPGDGRSAAGRDQRRGRPERRDRPEAAGAPRQERSEPAGAPRQERPAASRPDRPRRDRGGRSEAPAREKPAEPVDELLPGMEEFDQEESFEEDYARPARTREPEDPQVRENRCKEAASLLQEVIDRMGMTATVAGEVAEDDTLLLRVASADSAILIGRKGRTLSALQFIVNRMIAAQEGAEVPDRVVVDVEGYLDRRRESLEDMAVHLAEKAKQTGRNMRVKPLNPQERRVIHVKLQDDPDIRTFSMGDSLYRSVIISPKSAGQPETDRPRRSRGGRGGRYRGSRNGGREPINTQAGTESNDARESDEG